MTINKNQFVDQLILFGDVFAEDVDDKNFDCYTSNPFKNSNSMKFCTVFVNDNSISVGAFFKYQFRTFKDQDEAFTYITKLKEEAAFAAVNLTKLKKAVMNVENLHIVPVMEKDGVGSFVVLAEHPDNHKQMKKLCKVYVGTSSIRIGGKDLDLEAFETNDEAMAYIHKLNK